MYVFCYDVDPLGTIMSNVEQTCRNIFGQDIFTCFILKTLKQWLEIHQLHVCLFCFLGHTGRLLKSLCFTSLSFLLLHIIFQITINSLEAGKTIEPGFNCE